MVGYATTFEIGLDVTRCLISLDSVIRGNLTKYEVAVTALAPLLLSSSSTMLLIFLLDCRFRKYYDDVSGCWEGEDILASYFIGVVLLSILKFSFGIGILCTSY